MAWVYDMSLRRRCNVPLCCCCGPTPFQHNRIQLFSFDATHPEFSIWMRGDARHLFNDIGGIVDLASAAEGAWVRNRTARMVVQKHSMTPTGV
eukprot:a514721_3.p2 GENE.a514721_3~~a514721_3.p2  ORF type:complete len:106 (+),score=38.97 a514721_3:42-320(+)